MVDQIELQLWSFRWLRPCPRFAGGVHEHQPILVYDRDRSRDTHVLLYLIYPHVEGDQWSRYDHALHQAPAMLYGDRVKRCFRLTEPGLEEEGVIALLDRTPYSLQLMWIRLGLELELIAGAWHLSPYVHAQCEHGA